MKAPKTGISAALAIAYVSVAIDLLGVSIILPVIPQLVKSFSGDAFTVGIIFASYGGAQAISMPVSGMLSDRFGRRPMIILSLAGSCIGFFCQGLSRQINTFIAARICAGSFGGSIPIVQAYIADTYDKNERPRFLAGLSSVLALSFMFGPGIGAGLAQFSMYTPMFVSSGLAGIGVVLAYFYFTESKPHLSEEKIDSVKEGVELDELAIEDVERDAADVKTEDVEIEKEDFSKFRPLVYCMWFVSFLLMFSYSSFLSVYGYLVLEQFNWAALEVGFVGTATAIVAIIVQMVIFTRLFKRIGKHATGVIGFLIFATGLAMLPLGPFYISHEPLRPSLPSMVATVIALIFVSTGYALSQPALSSTISRYASSADQGRILGISQSMQATARVIGPIVLGSLYENDAGLPFFITAGTALLGGIVFYMVLAWNRDIKKGRGLFRTADTDDGDGSMDSVCSKECTPEERKEAALDLGTFLALLLLSKGVNVANPARRSRVKKTLAELVPLLKEAKSLYGEEYMDVLHGFIKNGNPHC